MTRTARLIMFGVAGASVAVAVILAILMMPSFGGSSHPYRDHAVVAGVHHQTSNIVSSVNFDQRGLDTLGEETILLASVIGVSVLLRPAEDETETQRLSGGRVLDVVRLGGYVLLPVTALIGLDVATHGHLTPGGGFQGGVVLGTGLHTLYLAGRYDALERVRPVMLFEWGEALGAGAFACLGISGLLVAGAFLVNVIPWGTFGDLMSGGTVPVLNGAVGVEVASGTMVLLSKFLEQAIRLTGGSGKAGSQESAKG
ncbi:MAG TPA: MnhB domain-containing protein [Acidimicrobiales bacterium]|nr:MnhB domain-containing protein [Acidimicrobiales bacterium]